ncbi:hypothetical protein Tco_0145664 [Tanacetum coccineum]
MACSLPHIVDEIKAMVQKQIEVDKVHQLAIMNLAIEFENASIAKDDLRKAYDECSDVSEEKRASIDTYLKQESDKDYEMHNTLFRKAAKIEQSSSLSVKSMEHSLKVSLNSTVLLLFLFLPTPLDAGSSISTSIGEAGGVS